MAITIIIKEDGVKQEKTLTLECDNEDWEERCYAVGCAVARELAVRRPALEGPHASRPWVRVLRNMTVDTHRLI